MSDYAEEHQKHRDELAESRTKMILRLNQLWSDFLRENGLEVLVPKWEWKLVYPEPEKKHDADAQNPQDQS